MYLTWFIAKYIGYGALGMYWALAAWKAVESDPDLTVGLSYLTLSLVFHVGGFLGYKRAERAHKDRLASSSTDRQ